MPRHNSFADAMSAYKNTPSAPPVAANDNKPTKARKAPEPRYRGTLPALRWLYDNHPDLAPAMAAAVQSLGKTEWSADAVDDELEIRPTIGEMVRAAADGQEEGGTPAWLEPVAEKDSDGQPFVRLGALKFKGNRLVEYGQTRKGRKLEPRDDNRPRGAGANGKRNTSGYMALRGSVRSPLHADGYQRPISTEPALIPMYDPQRDVEANRALLRSFGIDGGVPFEELPFPATKCRPAIAPGAEFLGGVVGLSGNSSGGALMWESPNAPKGEVRVVVEAVAAGGTLTDIGERMGLAGARIDRGAKDVLVDAAKVLVAANDNARKKRAA